LTIRNVISEKDKDESKIENKNLNEELLKAIPGGRYGCA